MLVYVSRSLTMFYLQKPLPSWWLQLWSWILTAASRHTFQYCLLLTLRHCQPQVKTINANEYETNISIALKRSKDVKYLLLSTQLKELGKKTWTNSGLDRMNGTETGSHGQVVSLWYSCMCWRYACECMKDHAFEMPEKIWKTLVNITVRYTAINNVTWCDLSKRL